jgi:flavin-dependent dehydrogenase
VARGESDLLAFKAHFEAAKLQLGRMPLIAFPGGYGGLVDTDGGRTSFSCCIRRRTLEACRGAMRDTTAAEAVARHVFSHCRGAREALADAVREGPWLATGPLRIGARSVCGDGFFAAGNAMAEAHPIVAEGISMAIQSGWLLSEALIAAGPAAERSRLNEIAQRYEAALRANFAMRMRAASVVASLAMRPLSGGAAARMLEMLPGLLAFGARCAGKVRTMRAAG